MIAEGPLTVAEVESFVKQQKHMAAVRCRGCDEWTLFAERCRSGCQCGSTQKHKPPETCGRVFCEAKLGRKQ